MFAIFNIRALTRVMAAVGLSCLMASCIEDASTCPSDKTDDTGVVMEFAMVTRNAAGADDTRALIIPPNTFPGFQSENYLDLDNLVFLIFDQNQKFVCSFSPEVTSENTVDYIKYRVLAFLKNPYFLNATADELTFSILVLGNQAKLNPEGMAFHAGQSLQEIFSNANVPTFSMPVRNNYSNSWIPSIFGGTYTDAAGGTVTGMSPAFIPMSGIQTFTVSTADLKKSSVDAPVQLTTSDDKQINMLRALAKIEVIDRMGITDGVQLPQDQRSYVEKVELIGHTSRGALLPTFPQWNVNGIVETQYASGPSVPNAASYIGASPENNNSLNIAAGFSNAIVNFFPDAAATAARADGCRVFSCYVTEYNPALLQSTDTPIWMRLTCQSPNGEGVYSSNLYRVNLAPYVNGLEGQSISIIRNNIYRYEITGIKSEVELELVVNNWNSQNTNWEFTDVPGMTDNGYLTWSSDILQEDRTTATIVYKAQLHGRFTFAEPKGGTWTAILVPGANTENDAFVFVGADGQTSTSVSGVIDGNPSVINIATKYSAGNITENRSARLLFTVRTPDGRTISANVLGSEYGDNKYFTIIQEPDL